MPIEPVGNCQKSSISQGCGYDERPFPGELLSIEGENLPLVEAPFEEGARVDAWRRMGLKEHEVAAVPDSRHSLKK